MSKSRFSFPFTFVLPLFCGLALGSTYFVLESTRSYLDVPIQMTQAGEIRLFVDAGRGFPADPSSSVTIAAGQSRIAHFALPVGAVREMRLQLPAGDATVFILGDAVIRSQIRALRPAQTTISSACFQPLQQIVRVVDIGSQRHFNTLSSGANTYPACSIRDFGTVSLQPDYAYLAPRVLGLVSLCLVLGLAAARIERRLRGASRAASRWVRRRVYEYPQTAILCAAAAGIIASCYPIIFFGKSFVSPNVTTILLYDRFPTVPERGATADDVEDPLNSDLGAMAWQDQPYSVVQNCALLTHGELPLWNRYNWCGVPLLGQGQSMFGDPLHFIVILANGASAAWDLKFLLAKLLFAFAIGLIVYACTKHRPTSLLLAFACSFIGFFTFRFNHPAFFSFCYSPLILLSWVRITQITETRKFLPWLLAFFVANWMEINSGTVKEAYMLCLSLNLTGFWILALGRDSFRFKTVKLIHLSVVAVALILASAPIWWTFLDTLAKSFTMSDSPLVFQVQSKFVIGLFDDIFYRQINTNEGFLLPSANFLILLGCALTLGYCYSLRRNRICVAMAAGIAVPFCMVFGLISASKIERIPFIGRIGQIHVVFSAVVIVQVIVLAGFGLALFATNRSVRRMLLGWSTVWVSLAGMISLFFFGTNGGPLVLSRMFFWIAGLIVGATVLLPVTYFMARRFRTLSPVFNQLTVLLIAILLWRHGLQLNSGSAELDRFVFNPRVRADLAPVSPALESIRPRSGDAARVIGVEDNLFAGYNDVQRLESLSGPDALEPKRVREMAQALGLDLDFGPWRIQVRQSTLQAHKAALDMLNVKYYAVLPGQLSSMPVTVRKVAVADFAIYQSDTAWPRAFFTDTALLYNSPAEFVNLVRTSGGRPFAAFDASEIPAQLRLSDVTKRDAAKRQSVAATNFVLTANNTSFDVVAPTPGIAVLSETYLPDDFRVYVNGKPGNYFRANYAFKGLWLERPGLYHVTFAYWPKHFTLALLCSGAGFGLLLTWIVTARKLPPFLQGKSSNLSTNPGEDRMAPA